MLKKDEPSSSQFCFDICQIPNVKLNASLLSENTGQLECFKNGPRAQELASGVVLLKNFINLRDQVKIIKKCRELGLGSGGFYQPGFKNGAKLNLQMMCLGKNWDPETKLYGHRRPIDDAEPPSIPVEFKHLVQKAIKTSRAFLKKTSNSIEDMLSKMALQETSNSMKDMIPKMSPDICIVNFYTTSGKLGLHQDKDESEKSISKGLPVVSFSLGDSALFLYGDKKVGNAKKVILESGDVLIFGGKSRLIYHGVAEILHETAPKLLLDETNLRPGRLNLTFRQY
ncbi:DNA N(6)-methyladenine demethylase ALKBH1C-like [Tasmannia lanceolata]|uniref:DNA N(6)-methyladenine demethylase ALKBH1C-like n=1 Tax=Tasmannia lanceolata TaxID=3420 RepID=UPI004063EAC6